MSEPLDLDAIEAYSQSWPLPALVAELREARKMYEAQCAGTMSRERSILDLQRECNHLMLDATQFRTERDEALAKLATARADALECAAKIAEAEYASRSTGSEVRQKASTDIAAKIRAIKETKP